MIWPGEYFAESSEFFEAYGLVRDSTVTDEVASRRVLSLAVIRLSPGCEGFPVVTARSSFGSKRSRSARRTSACAGWMKRVRSTGVPELIVNLRSQQAWTAGTTLRSTSGATAFVTLEKTAMMLRR